MERETNAVAPTSILANTAFQRVLTIIAGHLGTSLESQSFPRKISAKKTPLLQFSRRRPQRLFSSAP
jgi:hypothetical protein